MGSGDQVPVLVVAADWRYAMPMCVLLSSVERHLRFSPAVDVYILDCGIGWWNRRRIRKLFRGGKLRLHWRRVNERQLRRYPTSGHIKAAAYARLLIPDLLPESVTRAVYLDCDIVVLADIGELWGKDMGGAPLLARQESGKMLKSTGGVVRYRELGFDGDEPYLNSGVLLIDLNIWRQEGINAKIFKYLVQYAGDVVYHDQDGINAILAGRWGHLGEEWNWFVDCAMPAPLDTAGEEEFLPPAGVKLVHWASKCKPWHNRVGHQSVQYFAKAQEGAGVSTDATWQPIIAGCLTVSQCIFNRAFTDTLRRLKRWISVSR